MARYQRRPERAIEPATGPPDRRDELAFAGQPRPPRAERGDAPRDERSERATRPMHCWDLSTGPRHAHDLDRSPADRQPVDSLIAAPMTTLHQRGKSARLDQRHRRGPRVLE